MEEMETGELFEKIIDDGGLMLNVPRSIKIDGHKIIKGTPLGEVDKILIEKGI